MERSDAAYTEKLYVRYTICGQSYAKEKRRKRSMKYEWIDDYLLKKPGVTKDLQKEWNWIEKLKTVIRHPIRKKDT